ncbi:amino acid permease [Flavobacterium sp. NKUCC04_CG]|nr:amino acid permease [Flavobacterium sp. NKUCC04_CG]MBW3519784.1 amino acid permease [Flavobacterium sp. NKUCC04_CG]
MSLIKNLLTRKDYNAAAAPSELKKVLGLGDIVFLGIASIIGAGSFSSLGEAIFAGGPGVIFLYIICGFACCFTAMCYAEFASRIPTAGSAYTYAYASFGEIVAWIIGWTLIMEYSFGNVFVSFSWSNYFTSLMKNLGIHIPEFLSTSYFEAQKGILSGTLNERLINAWEHAPMLGNLKIIVDVPALCINLFITYVCYIGIKESRNLNNVFVLIKLIAIVLIIIVGSFYIDLSNWTPLNAETNVRSMMPNGFSGVMAAVSGVFFAYVGFDALSVLSEECKDPKRDLPRAMMITLVVCTTVYVLLVLVLTGMVDYRAFDGIGDPLSFIFNSSNANLIWMEFIISIVGVIAITTVLLVYQMGQPRIWYVMSKDGLLPKKFQTIHPKYKTPSFATIVTGIIVAIPIFFTEKSFILDFTSIGTIFAFCIVCGGILFYPQPKKEKGQFKIPFVNAKYVFPWLCIIAVVTFYYLYPEFFKTILQWGDPKEGEFRLSMSIYLVVLFGLSILTFFKKLSLIPLLGLASCMYLLTGMTHNNWFWFLVWFAIGMVVYIFYGYKHSGLRRSQAASSEQSTS